MIIGNISAFQLQSASITDCVLSPVYEKERNYFDGSKGWLKDVQRCPNFHIEAQKHPKTSQRRLKELLSASITDCVLSPVYEKD